MHIFRLITILFFITLHLSANEKITYDINGEKDPRLTAYYELTYIAKNRGEECTEKRGNSIAPKTKKEIFDIDDKVYLLHITVNATPEENDECAYEFQSLNLIIKRLYDEEVYNQFPIVGVYPSGLPWQKGNWAIPVYHGTKEGISSPLGFFNKRNEIPYAFRSDEKYFRVLYETKYHCMTSRYDESAEAEFMCLMDISDMLYRYQPCDPSSQKRQDECGSVHHQSFEINHLINQKFNIDIIADDAKSMRWNTPLRKLENDTFQIPDASVWEEFKHFVTSFKMGIPFF